MALLRSSIGRTSTDLTNFTSYLGQMAQTGETINFMVKKVSHAANGYVSYTTCLMNGLLVQLGFKKDDYESIDPADIATWESSYLILQELEDDLSETGGWKLRLDETEDL